jgi:hypothetical protein
MYVILTLLTLLTPHTHRSDLYIKQVISTVDAQSPLPLVASRWEMLTNIPYDVLHVILRILLVIAEPIDLWNLSYNWRSQIPHQILGLCPAILLANKSLSNEACRILYGYNTFSVTISLHPHDRNVWQYHGGTPHKAEPYFRAIDWLPECHYIHVFEQHAGKRFPLGRLTVHLEAAELGSFYWVHPVMRINTLYEEICRFLRQSPELPRAIELRSDMNPESSDWSRMAGRCQELSGAISRLMHEYLQWHLHVLEPIITDRTTFTTNLRLRQ